MPDPKDVFDNPLSHWALLTAPDDSSFEGQHFDRKAAGTPDSRGIVSKSQMDGLREHITGTLSAFANENRQGGLLALGISKAGEIHGIRHLSDEQRNSLTNFEPLLINQAARVRFVECQNASGEPDQICLIYVPYAEHGLCETPGPSPRAWRRSGAQNMPLSQDQREQFRREAATAGVRQVALPHTGPPTAASRTRDRARWFRRGYRWRAGIEGRIGVLQRAYGLDRCPDHGADGLERWVGFGVLTANLVTIARGTAAR